MKQCSNCGAELQEDTQFCMNCGTAVTEAAPVVAESAPEVPAPKKSNGKLIGLIAGGVALLAVIVFVIIGIATNWFRGPLGEIEVALEKTLKADSITIDVEVKSKNKAYSSTSKSSMEYQIVLNRDKRDMALMSTTLSDSYELKVLQIDGKSYQLIIYDDEVQSAQIEDLEKDAYETIYKIINNEYENDDEALEELMESYDLDADADEIRDFFNTLKKDCLGNQKWLEEFLGFEKKDGKYFFNIDNDDLTKEIAERAYEAGIISKSQKKEWTAEKTNQKFKVEITLANGYLSEIECVIKSEDYDLTYTVEFSDINDTELSNKEKNSIIDGVNEYIEEYCAYCNGCSKMDNKDWMYYAAENYYCSECYSIRSYCDDCGDFLLDEKLTSIDYYDLCERCHDEYVQEYYAYCADCKSHERKNSMYLIGENYYCYDCRWNRDYCDDCSAFVKEDELTRVNYTDYCKDCYDNYKAAHTCDLCGYLTGSNYICYEHTINDYCGNCGSKDTLNYYNVQTQKHLCWWCY